MSKKIKEVGEYLQKVQEKSITGQSESVAADGGNAVGSSIIPQVLAPDFSLGTIYERCKIFNVGVKANSVIVPCVSANKLDDLSIRGGVNAFWQSEGNLKTASSGKIGTATLALNTLAVIVPVTDELNQDVENLGAFVADSAQEAIRYKLDNAIIYGNDDQMNGILSTGNRSTGYLDLATISITGTKDMFDSYYGGENGIWVMSKAAFNEITDVYADNTSLYFDEGQVYLYGYPVKVSPVMRSTDIVLGDFTQYVVGQKEVRQSFSRDVRFLNDESLFKFVIRINGNSSWMQGVTLNDNVITALTGSFTELDKTITSDTSGRYANGSSAGFASIPSVIFGTLDSTSKTIVLSSFTVDVSSGGFALTEAGDGFLTSVSGVSGTIDYTTGLWTLDMTTNPLTIGTMISATYNYAYNNYATGGANAVTVYPFVYNGSV